MSLLPQPIVDQFAHVARELSPSLRSVCTKGRQQGGLDFETAASVQFVVAQVNEIRVLGEEIQSRVRAARKELGRLLVHLGECERQLDQVLGEPTRLLREAVEAVGSKGAQ